MPSNTNVGGNDGMVYKAIGVTAAVGAIAFVYWFMRKGKSKEKPVSTPCYIEVYF